MQRVERHGEHEQTLGAGVHGSTIARLWKRHGERDSSVKEEGRGKGKEEREERGKRGKESNQGALATRNPMVSFVSSGELPRRTEERNQFDSRLQEPPRNTRVVPDTGPSGFVDGLTE